MPNETPKSAKGRGVKVWDGPTRIIHWALPLLIAFSWGAAQWKNWEAHRLSGYVILGLLVFRVVWGFIGSDTARFSRFLRGPGATFAYLKTLGSRRAFVVPGHNPLGALSVIALLAVMLAQVILGLFAVDVDGLESGPLATYVSFDFGRACAKLHHLGFNLLLWLIGLHLFAIAFYLIWKRENLIGPMLGGSKVFAEGEAPPALRFAPVWRIALGVVLAGAATWLVAKGFKLP